MQLPFLRKFPRIAQEPRDPKTYGLSSSEKIEEHCINEIMDAFASHDHSLFRDAIEALVMNCFEED